MADHATPGIINVIIHDTIHQEKAKFELPSDCKLDELLQVLKEEFKLPQQDPNNPKAPAGYRLVCDDKELTGSKTVAEWGVYEGASIKIVQTGNAAR